MRLLDHGSAVRKLEQLGMPKDILQRIRNIVHRPNGLVLVTGPTGSGKTPTLYAALTELNKPQRKIITVEDPVEYQLPRINQAQVNKRINLDFARVLRTALRLDPDIILVGEMRDRETGEKALRAALTGHLVLSALHNNDAVSTAMRLIDSGRYKWHKAQLRLLLVGKVLYQAMLARFSRLFALVQRSGIPIVTGLSVVGHALDNDFVEERILGIRDGIERGDSLSNTAASTGIFDHLVLQMLQVGEESGATDQLLQDVADYYDDEVDYSIDKLSASIEPTLTIALAGLVFLLAIGIFLPMWDLAKVALH